jgi:hypothetical protein
MDCRVKPGNDDGAGWHLRAQQTGIREVNNEY